jgi:uncharacterized protein
MLLLGRAASSIAIFGVAIALASAVLVACGDGNSVRPEGDVRVEVTAVGFDQRAGTPYVQLDDRTGRRSLQIATGAEEARTITLELHGIKTARPLTNELLGKVIARTGHAVERVEVSEVRNDIYYAKIILDHGRYVIDSRPSDAIALALGVRAPIYVAAALMQSASASATDVAATVTATKFGVTVQELTADLALYFGVEAGSGVVIADLAPHAVSIGLQRGDIVIEAGGKAVRTPADFVHVASPGSAPIALTIRRGGATHTISVAPAATTGVVP